MPKSDHKPSQITQQIINELLERDRKGQEKYGVTMDRTDLKFEEWIQHHREELFDALQYITRVQRDIHQSEQKYAQFRERILKLSDDLDRKGKLFTPEAKGYITAANMLKDVIEKQDVADILQALK